MTSPTVSNCTNEPQIESKEKMRQRMAKVSLALKGSPKVRVSTWTMRHKSGPFSPDWPIET